MKKIHAPVSVSDKGASERSRLLALGRRGDILKMRSKTPRRKGTWLPRDEGEFDGFGGVETRTRDTPASQDGQCDWDDDLWILHPICIWLGIELRKTVARERKSGLPELPWFRVLELSDNFLSPRWCLLRRCGLGRS